MEVVTIAMHSKNSLDFPIYSWISIYSDFQVVTTLIFKWISNIYIC